MIYAKTDMERMPEGCFWCEKHFAFGKGGHCTELGCVDGNVTNGLTRLPNCPLTEIDETLSVQLECAEMRLGREERLGNRG